VNCQDLAPFQEPLAPGSEMGGHALSRWKTGGVPSRIAASTRAVSLLPGVPVSVDSKGKNSAAPSYALELHVRGVIHIQIERLPPVKGAHQATASHRLDFPDTEEVTGSIPVPPTKVRGHMAVVAR
jgi:hypothetical protein